MTINNSNLANLRIKLDYFGNPYVLVTDQDNPSVYYPVYLAITEPEEGTENSEESAFRNHSAFN